MSQINIFDFITDQDQIEKTKDYYILKRGPQYEFYDKYHKFICSTASLHYTRKIGINWLRGKEIKI